MECSVTTQLTVNINDETEDVFKSCEARGISRASALSAGVGLLMLLENAVQVRLVDRDGTIEVL